MPTVTILARLFEPSCERGDFRGMRLAQLLGPAVGSIGPLPGFSHKRLQAFNGSFKRGDPGMFAPYVLSYGMSRAKPYVATRGAPCVLPYGVAVG
jgi:hypothetical protein